MPGQDIILTGVERFFDKDEIIVSKTDLKGRLTYTNDVFLSIADYTEREVLGEQHNIIRHPEMPRCIFQILWDTIQAGNEIFAYVINRTKHGDHYWVLAHVTPSRDASGNIVGYHSNRRLPDKSTINEVVIPLYRELLAEEKSHANRKDGLNASVSKLTDMLVSKGLEVNEFVLSL